MPLETWQNVKGLWVASLENYIGNGETEQESIKDLSKDVVIFECPECGILLSYNEPCPTGCNVDLIPYN